MDEFRKEVEPSCLEYAVIIALIVPVTLVALVASLVQRKPKARQQDGAK